MKYLLDSNTFIEAKGRYYGMAICPAYWAWLLKAYEKGQVCSIEFVKEELIHYGDDLSDWVKAHKHIFFSESDAATQKAFVEVVNIVYSMSQMNAGTHEEFLSGADPWLIAKAMVLGATIVTHERYDVMIKKKILIPNICERVGVKYLNTFDMLHELEAEFVLSV
ncbi:DUF4411 family protein [Shewanella sp. SM87]|jgi:hypothetical protein|uniref:DUF4411 domain-containing protein n=1 Tax=Shewanella putrefaciens (strain 200) TaxID=399804 RepID=E6XP68_SHEP2|nr:DUF4411 family protein [Shewanella sp. SM87]MCU8010459.1 DUF4411 family protein [Shewanella sp. SM87]